MINEFQIGTTYKFEGGTAKVLSVTDCYVVVSVNNEPKKSYKLHPTPTGDMFYPAGKWYDPTTDKHSPQCKASNPIPLNKFIASLK